MQWVKSLNSVEIIIGDDGSSAEYHEKYRSLEGENVRVISSEKNIGRAAIRNRLALEAKGDFLLFIDADAMMPGTAEAYMPKWMPYMIFKCNMRRNIIS